MKSFQYILVITAYLLLVSDVYANEKTNYCNNTNAEISYKDIEDYKMVCQSINDVLTIAKKIGIDNKFHIKLSIVDSLKIKNFGHALATFKPSTMEIEVLSMKACKSKFGNEVILGQNIDESLYRSIIVHELAHALFWQNKKNMNIGREMHEYFAYVIQLTLLDETYRKNIILSSDVPAFSNWSEITEDYYLLDPTRFAVKSYLHFINTQNNWVYLQRFFKE